MSSITCSSSNSASSCQNKIADQKEVNERCTGNRSGRRLYINEDSLTSLAKQGYEEAQLIYQMAARTVALKAVHHIHQDSEMLGVSVPESAQLLKEAINSLWSANATQSLRRVAYRPNNPRQRDTIVPVLNQGEAIFASCYFSNYYTFATCPKSAELMFADTNEIATMRQLMRDTALYDDLTLLYGHCLVLINSDWGVGSGRAAKYFHELRIRPQLSATDLATVKGKVYWQTKDSLKEMFDSCLDPTCLADRQINDQIMQAVDYAFSKGILKNAVTAASLSPACPVQQIALSAV